MRETDHQDKSEQNNKERSGNIFNVGDLVALRSNPQNVAAVVEWIGKNEDGQNRSNEPNQV